jgi:menaquinone-specific isochorismate synthase
MAGARVTDVVAPTERRLASASVYLEGAVPGGLLRLGEGTPRGLWARDGRWIVHAGEVSRVEVSCSHGSPERFRTVGQRARTLLSSLPEDFRSGVSAPAPRLFGGFSFREDHEALGLWEGFPAACFVLPEWELTGGARDTVLTLRVLLPPGQDLDGARGELHARLHAFKARLEAPVPQGDPGSPWVPATRSHPDQASWVGAVERAVAAVTGGEISKVVLARVQSVVTEDRLDPVEVVLNLWRENPGAHVFLFEPVPGRALVGAAPETVATVTGGSFQATAVAGSTGRGKSEKETASLARKLLSSRKDLAEHRICVDDMVHRLSGLARKVEARDGPRVLTLPTIQHLETVVEAQLRPGVTILSALEALHPTPAVCGLPRDRALEFLRKEERFPRGWYAGPVGWFDGEGDGVFVPALRSAVGRGNEWHLFAGAGIVEGSDPEWEWEETRIKFQPVLRALAAADIPLEEGGGPSGAPEPGKASRDDGPGPETLRRGWENDPSYPTDGRTDT